MIEMELLGHERRMHRTCVLVSWLLGRIRRAGAGELFAQASQPVLLAAVFLVGAFTVRSCPYGGGGP